MDGLEKAVVLENVRSDLQALGLFRENVVETIAEVDHVAESSPPLQNHGPIHEEHVVVPLLPLPCKSPLRTDTLRPDLRHPDGGWTQARLTLKSNSGPIASEAPKIEQPSPKHLRPLKQTMTPDSPTAMPMHLFGKGSHGSPYFWQCGTL